MDYKFSSELADKCLYKYRSMPRLNRDPRKYDEHALSYVRDIFLKQELYFPSPIDLNDPHECRPFFQVADFDDPKNKENFVNYAVKQVSALNPEKDLDKIRAWAQKLDQDAAQKMNNETAALYQTYLFKGFRICGFSVSKSDPLLWSHYSSSHKGICLIFDTDNDLFSGAIQVQYSDEYPIIPATEVDDEDVLFKSILTKYSAWAYECEYRLLSMEPNELGALPVKDKKLIFEKTMLKGVIFGCRTPQEDKELVKHWCEIRESPIQFFQAKLNDKNYQLDIIPH